MGGVISERELVRGFVMARGNMCVCEREGVLRVRGRSKGVRE